MNGTLFLLACLAFIGSTVGQDLASAPVFVSDDDENHAKPGQATVLAGQDLESAPMVVSDDDENPANPSQATFLVGQDLESAPAVVSDDYENPTKLNQATEKTVAEVVLEEKAIVSDPVQEPELPRVRAFNQDPPKPQLNFAPLECYQCNSAIQVGEEVCTTPLPAPGSPGLPLPSQCDTPPAHVVGHPEFKGGFCRITYQTIKESTRTSRSCGWLLGQSEDINGCTTTKSSGGIISTVCNCNTGPKCNTASSISFSVALLVAAVAFLRQLV